MDFEIAHVNICLKSEEQKAEELEAFIDKSLTEADEGIAGCTYLPIATSSAVLYLRATN